jgi:hypothetical protein
VTREQLMEWVEDWLRDMRTQAPGGRSLMQSIYLFQLDDSGVTEDGRQVTVKCKPSPPTMGSAPVPFSARAERFDSALRELGQAYPVRRYAVIGEHLALVPVRSIRQGERGVIWRHIAYEPTRGQEGHQAKLAAFLGLSGARAFRQQLEYAYVWLEGHLSHQRAA